VKKIVTANRLFREGSPWPERILLCLPVLMAYASVWPNAFVFDDKPLLVENIFLKHWSNLPQLLTALSFTGGGLRGQFYRPVPALLHFFIYQAFGLSTIAFHALNIALQAFNACLLHHFGVRAGFKKGAAFAAALLWAVHPLHTAAVAYMSITPELLWCSFCLLGLITLLPDFTPRKIWCAVAFFMLALGSKESAVVFPALAAVTFFFVSKDRTKFSAYLKMWPLWLLALGYTVVWLLFIRLSGYKLNPVSSTTYFQDYTSNLTNRVLTCLATLPVYARLILWPAGLHIDRTFPVFNTLLAWQSLTGALMAGLGLLQIFCGRARALSFGLLWFAIVLSPYTGIVTPNDALISESWMYMPTMGLFLGVTQTVAGFFERKKSAARLLGAVLALSLGIATFLQNRVWRDTETVYQNIILNGGDSYQLSIPMGDFYLERGEFDKAMEQYQIALDYAGRLHKMTAIIHLRLAEAWLQVSANASQDDIIRALPSCQHIPEAIAELGKTLQSNPDFYWAHIILAVIYRSQGNSQMADFHMRKVAAILQKQGDRAP